MVVHNPLQSIAKAVNRKVHKQTNGQIQEFQISQHLSAMNWGKPFHGFQFDQQTAFHQQIGPKSLVNDDAVICQGDQFLSFH